MSGPTSAQILFGCVLKHPAWFADIASLFDKRTFGEAVDKKVWARLAELHEQGKQATPIDVLGTLAEVQGGADAARNLSELMSLCEFETPRSFQGRVDDLIKTSKHSRVKRRLKKMASAVDELPLDHDWAATLDTEASKLRKLDRRKKHYTPLSFDRFVETASNKRRKVVIPTGFRGVDERIGGFIVGHTTAICARTNVGKSTVLAALARNQFLALAARNPDRVHQREPNRDPYDTRLKATHARHPKNDKVGERAPYVLILSVEDDLDDYLGRIVCDMCDVRGNDYMLDPEHSIADKGDQFLHVARTCTADGRLTIADYESEDGDDEKTIDEIEKTILGWKALVEEPFIARDEPPPPLLVLLDYFQKIELPTEEGKGSTPEYVLLKKASSRLHKLAKRNDFAFVPAVMLLRAPDSVEPDHNDARGGSDVIQDAEVVLTLWPFGPGERAALAELQPGENVVAMKPSNVADSFEDAVPQDTEDLDEYDLAEGEAVAKAAKELSAKQIQRACNELLISGHKGRHVQAGWQVPLEFDRDHKRITDAYDMGVVYRRHPDIVSVLKAHRKSQGERKR